MRNHKEDLSADEEQDETDGPFERLLQLEIRKQVEAAWQVQQKIARLAWIQQPSQAATSSLTTPLAPLNDSNDDDKNNNNPLQQKVKTVKFTKNPKGPGKVIVSVDQPKQRQEGEEPKIPQPPP